VADAIAREIGRSSPAQRARWRGARHRPAAFEALRGRQLDPAARLLRLAISTSRAIEIDPDYAAALGTLRRVQHPPAISMP
jgi:hypothetical protein